MGDNVYVSRSEKSQLLVYFLIILCIVFLVFGSMVLFAKFGSIKSVFGRDGAVVVDKHSCVFSFRAKDLFSDEWVFPEYIIKKEGRKVKSGRLMPNIKEEFSTGEADNYTIYAYDDDSQGFDYYAGWKNCTCGEECIVEVMKEGDVSLIANREDDHYNLMVRSFDGFLNPYVVCFRRSFGVVNVYPENTSSLNLSSFEIPKSLDGKVDDCFFVNKTLKDGVQDFPVYVVKDEHTTDCEIDVFLVDSAVNRFFEVSFGDYGVEDVVYSFNC